VPPRVDACRCGSARASGADALVPDPDLSESRPAVRPIWLVAVGLVLGLTVALPARSWWMAQAGPPAPAVSEAPVPAPPVLTLHSPPIPAPEPPRDEPPRKERDRPADAEGTRHDPSTLEDIVATVVPAVASIEAGRARGTGFFVTPDTLITNAHVVEGQTSVRLRVGQVEQTARVATVSPANDLAILRVYPVNPDQVTLRLGSVAHARVGQEVIAVGSALGVLSNTVTRGIVSAVRQIGSVTLVQTDAAINPGNSGGARVDRTRLGMGV
jgi:S1-C subfamily serine protease